MEHLCPFPETTIVKSIRKKHSQAQFIETSTPQRIEFSRTECSKLKPEFLQYVVYHEVGHWFQWNHIPLSEIAVHGLGDGFLILDCVDVAEGFADGFAAYFIEHHTLATKHPEHERLLTDMLSSHEERIACFCEEVLAWLSHQLELGEHGL